MRTVLRILAIILAIFILAGALGDLFGILHTHGSIYTRFHRNFIPIITAILLLVPLKSLKAGIHGFIYLVALFAVNCWYSLIWMQTFSGFFHGRRSCHVLPVGLLMMAILWGTFWTAISQYLVSAPAKRRS